MPPTVVVPAPKVTEPEPVMSEAEVSVKLLSRRAWCRCGGDGAAVGAAAGEHQRAMRDVHRAAVVEAALMVVVPLLPALGEGARVGEAGRAAAVAVAVVESVKVAPEALVKAP